MTLLPAVTPLMVPSAVRTSQPDAAAQSQLRADWKAAFASQPNEFAQIPVQLVSGTPPVGLQGTLFKNGPARFERGGLKYAHWLDGDGYMTALHIRSDGSGDAVWSGRYVETEAFQAETARDLILFRTTFGTQRPGGILANILDIRLKSPANTNVLPLGPDGPLLALWEAGPPYELDPVSLACRGPSTLDGRLRLSTAHGALPATTGVPWVDRLLERVGLLTDACSAHPREDDVSRGTTVAWSWRQRLVGEPAIEVALHDITHDASSTAQPVLPPAPPSCPVRATLTGVPFAPHDMALTPSFAVFMSSPTRVDIAPFILGLRGPAQCTVFDAQRTLADSASSRLHLVDRRSGVETSAACDGDSVPVDAAAFDIGAVYHPVHMANAWEETTEEGELSSVTLLASCWPASAVRRLAHSGSSILGSWEALSEGDFSDVPMTNLVRFELDLASRRLVSHTILAEGVQLDHPRVHPHWATRRSRFVFGTVGRLSNGGVEDATPKPPQTFGCVDTQADNAVGELIDVWHAGTRRLVDEATLVPIEGADADDERAVWLLAPIFDAETSRSSYVVLDGRNLAAGPVCEWALPTFVPWGLHGAWRSE